MLEYGVDYLDFAPPLPGRFTNAELFIRGKMDKPECELVRDLIEKSPCSSIVISDEELFCAPEIFRHPVFSDYIVEVLFYLRAPVDVVASWAGEFSRPYNHLNMLNGLLTCSLGGLVQLEAGIAKTTSFYREKLTHFVEFFETHPEIKLKVRPFERQQFYGGNILSDFLTQVGVQQKEISELVEAKSSGRVNEGQTRKFLDTSAITLNFLKMLGLDSYYDETLVWEIERLCKSGDPRSVIDTLTDLEIGEIYQNLIPLYERIASNELFEFEGFKRSLIPEQFGKKRENYIPVDTAEIRNLVSRYVVLRKQAEKATIIKK